jgi:hypothetical protein
VTVRIKGELEVDSERGVIYFHTWNARVASVWGGTTLLRICGLPTPIPLKQLDITHMHGANWGGKIRVGNISVPPTPTGGV